MKFLSGATPNIFIGIILYLLRKFHYNSLAQTFTEQSSISLRIFKKKDEMLKGHPALTTFTRYLTPLLKLNRLSLATERTL